MMVFHYRGRAKNSRGLVRGGEKKKKDWRGDHQRREKKKTAGGAIPLQVSSCRMCGKRCHRPLAVNSIPAAGGEKAKSKITISLGFE